MKKLLSDKDISFDMTHAIEEESDSKNIKGHKMHVENPRKWMKNHNLIKNEMFLLYSALYYVGKRGHFYTIRVFFLNQRSCFLPSYLINFLLSSVNIYLGSYPSYMFLL